jgi:hypothetical protein
MRFMYSLDRFNYTNEEFFPADPTDTRRFIMPLSAFISVIYGR